VHGSAPDIAGNGAANPIAMIASFAMALRYSFGMKEWAERLDQAIAASLEKGLRTPDIMQDGMTEVGTSAMGASIVEELERAAD
jgi:3-isopropylmalate dehydrogenase